MEITQILAYAVIAVVLVLILITLYLYRSLKLRMFYLLACGFAALLLACAIPVFISGNTSVLTSILEIAAGLFFASGVLTAV